MELVRGEPITEFCDRVSLAPDGRMRLFQQVCSAVQHAHHKGVIHRDLKPSNILVTERDDEPVPKVIDFGIAKATNQELTRRTLFTELRQMIGTPQYMAPEQAQPSALDVDTRADVYSLGVILYELLTGTRPVDVDTLMERGYEEVLRHIREVDPPRPSSRLIALGDQLSAVAKRRGIEPQNLGRLLRGDLDWIVMKALEKDRSRRYETAVALAADVQRYLDRLPVEAGPPSRLYRWRKMFRRHRTAVLTVSFVVVLCVAAAIVSTSSAIEAFRSRNEAKRHLDEAVRLQVLSQQQSYVGNIYAAEAALRSHDGWGARRRLEAAPSELRGWEWRFLTSRADRSVATLQPVAGKSEMLAVQADGPHLCGAWPDDVVRVFDARAGREVAQLTGHTARIVCAAFSHDGERLYTASMSVRCSPGAGGSAGCWRSPGMRVASSRYACRAMALASRPLVGQDRQGVGRAERSSGPHVRARCPVNGISLSPDGSRLAVATWDQSLTLWDAIAGTEIGTLRAARASTPIVPPVRWSEARISTMCFDPGSSRLVTGARDGMLKVWNAGDGALVWENGSHRHVIRDVAVSPDGERIAVASLDRTATLWELASGEIIATLLDHRDDVRALAFSADSNHLATASWDHSVKLWDGRDGRPIGTLIGHAQGVYDVAFLAGGERLSTRSEDGTVKIWSVAPVLRDTLHGHRSHVFSAAFATDDRLVTSSTTGAIKVWNLASGRRGFDVLGPSEGVRCIAVDSGGGLLAAALLDHRIGLWEPRRRTTCARSRRAHRPRARVGVLRRRRATGLVLARRHREDLGCRAGPGRTVFEGHTDEVSGIGFSAGDRRVVTSSYDGTARAWDAASGTEELALTFTSAVDCLA